MKVYLDVSCLSRPFDDQSQERVRLEAEAVKLILDRCAGGQWQHVSSEMALIEVEANPDREKRRKVRILLPEPSHILPNSERVFSRAGELEELGLNAADAIHVAAAEIQMADVMFTCDDRLIRIAARLKLPIRVANPLVWMEEQQDA